MKKSKIKMLTAAACLALVGTASAAWVYAGTATASANIGVKVASYADAGTITVSGNDNLRVYLDRDGVTYTKEDSTLPFTATYTKPDGFDEKTVTLTYQVVISSYLAHFVKFADGVNTIATTDGSISTDFSYEWISGNEITNLPELAWTVKYADETVLAQKESYFTAIGMITGNAIGADFDQNKEWDAIGNVKGYNIKINFQAVVANS